MIENLHMRMLLLLVLSLSAIAAEAQPEVSEFKSIFRLEISQATSEIKIDGKLDDPTWQQANIGSDFWLKVPYFEEGADPRTEVMLSYNDKFLYVAAKCYQKEDILVQSLERDQYWDNDGIAIMLDPLNSGVNGFLFGVTGVGAQWDALRSLDDINSDWSNKWYSATFDGDGYWSMEMAIPLRILRFSPDQKEWGMNFVRNHMNENEYHNWTAVPESFWPPDPAFAGALVFDEAPKVQKGNYNLIPYVTSTTSQLNGEGSDQDFNIGLDARASITSTLNLDLTFNPDFSQVGADELVTNLTRFNIFLPERRTFFLENSDLFADFGYGGVRPFFSRTIGLDKNRQAVPIIYGARLTGNLTPSSRIGVMNIHSGSSDNSPGQNQTAITGQKLFGRSFVKGMFLNRQSFDGGDQIKGDYGRNTSIEAAYQSNNGQVAAWGAAHHSFKEDITDDTGFYTGGVSFRNPNWDILLATAVIEENYFTDMGFVQRIENYDAARDTSIRLGFNENVFNVRYTIRPQSGAIMRHNISSDNTVFFNLDGSLNERINSLQYGIDFRSTATFRVGLESNETHLLYPFRFVSEGDALPAGEYSFTSMNISFDSDERKPLSFGVDGRTGSFFNGNLTRLAGDVNYRFGNWANVSMGYQWNDLSFPDDFGSRAITAWLSRVEIGFNKNLFWSTIFQYVDQSEYMGVNSRLQWRFAPMSDLYLVYLDNYDVLLKSGGGRSIDPNNRALVLRLNYWY